jgi:peptidoglycan hydrolase-like protein with peptidoglycan-binding domain
MVRNMSRFRPSPSFISRLAVAAGTLVLVSVVLSVAPAEANAGVSATVGADAQALEAANSLSAAGLLTGWDAGKGVLQEYLTRGQLAILLARALDLDDSTTPHFGDVTSSQECFGAIGALYEAGLVTGANGTIFAPDELVSRQRAVLWIVGALGQTVAEQTTSPVPFRLSYFESAAGWLGGFKDRPLIAAECARAVANACRLGIVDATSSGWFYPTTALSWGDAAIMLDKAFVRPVAVRSSLPKALEAKSSYAQQKVKSKGPLVRYLEYQLAALKYFPGPIDGVYDNRTRDAVMAFQKVEGLKRTGTVGDVTWERLSTAQTPAPKLTDVGTRIEVDLTRQVLFMITDDKVWKIVHVSTGRQGTRTGHYSIKEKYKGTVSCITVDGVMYYPSYIVSRTAIHGYRSVPSYPASHGCVRVPMWVAKQLWNETPTGMTIDIYYNNG